MLGSLAAPRVHPGAGGCVFLALGRVPMPTAGLECFDWNQSHHAQGHSHSVCVSWDRADKHSLEMLPTDEELVAEYKGRRWGPEYDFSGNTPEARPENDWHCPQSSHLRGTWL